MADQFAQLMARMDQLTQTLAQQANNAQPTARLRGPPAPTFAGHRGDDVENFLFQLQNYLDVNQVQRPGQQMQLAVSLLRDHALVWYRSLPAGPSSLQEFAQLLRDTFTDVDEQRGLRQRLRELRQTTDAHSYVQDFRALMVRIDDMGVLDRIEAFIVGLRPRTRREVSFHAPDTLEEAYQLALRYDRSYHAAGRPRWNQPLPLTTNHTYPGAPMDVDAVSTRPRLRRLTETEREDLRRRGACFRCRQEGHMARDCPLFPSTRTAATTTTLAAKNSPRQ